MSNDDRPLTDDRNDALEDAAKVADKHSSPPFGHDDPVAVRFWHLGEAYARNKIARAIRQLKTI